MIFSHFTPVCAFTVLLTFALRSNAFHFGAKALVEARHGHPALMPSIPTTVLRAINRKYAYQMIDILNDDEDGGEGGEGEGEGEDDEDDEDEEQQSSGGENDAASAMAPVSDDNQISLLKEGFKATELLNGTDVRVGIIMARWNADIISGLYKGVNESLMACGVKPSNVFTTYVPGAFELPITARFLAASKRFDVLICLGCLIKGETLHFEYIAEATAHGIMNVGLETYVPVIFGVLTVLNKDQAIKRSTGTTNEGLSWGKSAVEMGLARMSALGMDRKQQKKDTSSAFVTFNASFPNAGSKGNNTDSKPRRFGF